MIKMIKNSVRYISTKSGVLSKVVPSNLKGKSKSSQEWLTRQLSDPYVEKAKILNYRCRSAFKLLEIDDKYKIIKPGHVVIDCGAAPGSWSQIAVERSNAHGNHDKLPNGTVIGIDLLNIHPLPGATFLNGSFISAKVQEKIKSILNGKAINCVISDMAPNATGVRTLDQESIVNLCYSVLRFSLLMSTEGACLLMKVWDNNDVNKLEENLQKYYGNVKRLKPQASRADSSELFLLAREFKGIVK